MFTLIHLQVISVEELLGEVERQLAALHSFENVQAEDTMQVKKSDSNYAQLLIVGKCISILNNPPYFVTIYSGGLMHCRQADASLDKAHTRVKLMVQKV